MDVASNPFHVMQLAAQGSLEAQRAIARYSVANAMESGSMACALVGILFSRLAFLQSDEPEDAGRLITALAAGSTLGNESGPSPLCDEIMAEALAVTSVLADAGQPNAEDALPSLTDSSSPEAAIIAKEIAPLIAATRKEI